MPANLFDGFDPAAVAAVQRSYRANLQATGEAKATRRRARHNMRRAKAETALATILPARFDDGDTWHVLSHGDIDALSYLRHALNGVPFFDHVLISTWCIAAEDMHEIQAWLDTGKIESLHLCCGEIFPSQYGDEYELATRMVDTYGVRLTIARNHSKVILAENIEFDYCVTMEGSANVNTNPRIEQTSITRSRELLLFYREFYDALRSIDRSTRK